MKLMKLIFILYSIAISKCVLHGMDNVQKLGPYPKAFFNDPNPNNSEIRDTLVKLIKGENRGIWAALDSCTDTQLLKAWEDRISELEMIPESSEILGGYLKGCLLLNRGYKKNLNGVLQQGLPCFMVPPPRKGSEHSRMHNKFIIFESSDFNNGDPLVVTGSCNATWEGFNRDYNNIVIISDPNVIGLYVREFQQLYAYAKLDMGFPRIAENYSESIVSNALFNGNIKEILHVLFSMNWNSIVGAHFVFQEKFVNLSNALMKSNAPAILIIDADKEKIHHDEAVLNQLKTRNEFELYKMPIKNGEQMHHKFFVFNAADATKSVVVTGSANMSGNSLYDCWENVFVCQNAALTMQFNAQVEKLKRIALEAEKLLATTAEQAGIKAEPTASMVTTADQATASKQRKKGLTKKKKEKSQVNDEY